MKTLSLLFALCLAGVINYSFSPPQVATIESAATQKLTFSFYSTVGSDPVNYESTYQTAEGRKFFLNDVRFYVSNIVLIKNDGSQLPLSGKVFLVDPVHHDYELSDVPVGAYRGFKFMVGLDSVTNHADPSVYPFGNPLAMQTPTMHWDWNSGYVFFKLEGRADTTSAADRLPQTDFFFHLATDKMKRMIDFSTSSFYITAGSIQQIKLQLDLLKVLKNVNMHTEIETHTTNNPVLAKKIADNLQQAFMVWQ